MATRPYFVQFGSGDPRTYTGLNPTFLFFINPSGATAAPPSISEQYVGTGIYRFLYEPLTTMAFLIDGATTGLQTADRYVTGAIDPLDNVLPYFEGLTAQFLGVSTQIGAIGATLIAEGATVVAIGNTLTAQGATIVAIGNSLSAINTNILGLSSLVSGIDLKIGSTASSYGTTAVPGDIFGYAKRIQQILEGDQVYTKASGILQFFGLGSSTLLRQKTITDDTTDTTRT